MEQPVLHFLVAAFFILSVILISMVTRRVIKGLSNKLFFHVVIITLLAVISDFFSELSGTPIPLKNVFNYLYFIFTILVSACYIFYIYANAGLWHHIKGNKLIQFAIVFPSLFTFIILIINIFTHWAFYVDENGVYVRGPLQLGLIICSMLYLISSFFIILKWWKVIPIQRKIPLMMLAPAVVTGLIIQQLYIGFELTLFGLTIGILIVSYSVQREDESFVGIKNDVLANADIEKVINTNDHVCGILIKITNYASLRRYLGKNKYESFIKVLSNDIENELIHTGNHGELYYMHSGTFGIKIPSGDVKLAETIGQKIIDEILNHSIEVASIDIDVDPRVVITRIPEDINTMETVIDFQHNFDKILPPIKHEPMILSDFLESKDFKIKNEINEIIERAYKEHNFKMYYQPIYSVQESKFIGAEALIRLIDNKYGFISPDIFIPAAEESGAIFYISKFVREDVCRFILENDIEKLGLECIEMNLSSNECIENNFVENFESLIERGLKPSQLKLEITETAAFLNPVQVEKNVRKLARKHNFAFALDDYGTGYSNIKRLATLPLEVVKLDKSFVDEIRDSDMRKIIGNTVKMFQQLKKKIVVEGVEDEETLNFFAALGCDYIQGYIYSKPLPEEDFIKFIKEKNKISE